METFRTSLSRIAAVALTLLAATALVACGSGSSGSSSGATTSASSSSASSSLPAADPAIVAMLPRRLQASRTLTVANVLNYPPFEYVTASGAYAGLDIDLIRALTSVMGLKLKIVRVAFESMIPGLANGRYDLALASFTDTADRRKVVNFVDFINAGLIISVPAGNPSHINGPDDLCGQAIATAQGSFASQWIAQTLAPRCKALGKANATNRVFPDQPSEVLALINGRVAARVDDSTTSWYFNDAPQTKGKLTVVGSAFATQPAGFAVGKSDTALLNASKAALQKLIDDGTYGKIMAKNNETPNAVTVATINAGRGS